MPATRAPASAAEPRDRPAAPAVTAPPLGDAEFAGLMAGIGLDAAPLAVAVSGGPDSLALTLLAAEWARRRGVRFHAFTVDHGLRGESAAEAGEVAGWLARAGIAHDIVQPDPALARGASAAAARAARYRALGDACRTQGIGHLLLAHHRDDQAETVLMRVARGTGLAGAAGMAARDQRGGLALCRPLLAIDPARLRATLRARAQDWIEDPSNRDAKAERVRVRAWLADRADGDAPARWAARTVAPALARLDEELAALADETAAVMPEGFAWLVMADLEAAPPVLVRHLLGRLLTGLSGNAYPPRGRVLDGALAALRERRAVTAHGCILRPADTGILRGIARGPVMLLAREPAAIAGPARVGELPERRWDGRFTIAEQVPDDWEILSPGAAGWRKAVRELGTPEQRSCGHLPGVVRAGLPVFRAAGRIVAVPFMAGERAALLEYAPRNPLIRAGLRVALPGLALI